MRIAVINASCHTIGGAETYLEQIVPELLRLGHDVAFWAEKGLEDSTAFTAAYPAEVTRWYAESKGHGSAMEALRAWQPDVLYMHGLYNFQLEAEITRIAPTLFYAHNYYGSCISGRKAHFVRNVRPCGYRFGAGCLLLFYPCRCGGLNPLTMWRDYNIQKHRRDQLRRYNCVAVASAHMARELSRYGIPRVELLHLYNPALRHVADDRLASVAKTLGSERRLLFLGRMGHTKGGDFLLDALPGMVCGLDRTVTCHFAGSGTEKTAWQARAEELRRQEPRLRIVFHPWLDVAARGRLLTETDLIVVPSLWPEPFGLVGLEAATQGVPAVAFDVGGIGEWLYDGINGVLASGNPPRAAGLTQAVVAALSDPENYRRLSRGALKMAGRFSLRKHLDRLQGLLESVWTSPYHD